MRSTQGAFSYLPPLSDDEIRAQLRWALGHGWAISILFTDDPHPRNTYWQLWGQPRFDVTGPEEVMADLARCREAFPDHYLRIDAVDTRLGRTGIALSFLVQRPLVEPSFRLTRAEGPGRMQRYGLERAGAAGGMG